MALLEEKIRPLCQSFAVDPVILLLSRWRFVTPVRLTCLSAFVGCLVFVALLMQANGLAFLFLWLSGYLDTLDGSLARALKRSSAFGAVLDIVVDRWVEFLVILGLFLQFPAQRGLWCLLMLGAVLLCVSSFLVVGVFSENSSQKSFHYSPGLMERAEAFLFFSLMMLLPSACFPFLALIFVGLVLWTAFYRVFQFKHQFN